MNAPNYTEQIAALSSFKKRDKFSEASWNARGLNPSDDEVCQQMNNIFMECADSLIEALKVGASKQKLKTILTKSLHTTDKFVYDTEEREFIVDLFHELSEILEIDINSSITKWLYGPVSALVLRLAKHLNKRKMIRTLEQPCDGCGVLLKTYILREEQGIAETSFEIVRCNNCSEYNLIRTGPNVKEMRFGNYVWVENLSVNEYTYEEAKNRLEQIKSFRK